MRKTLLCLSVLFLVTLVSGPLLAQENIVYPAQGQSAEQMEKDKFECYTWARNQTGFDPMKVPTATAPPPEQQAGGSVAGGAVKGGLGGAALGAAIGAIAGDAGKGAAIGAASGGLLGGARRHSQASGDRQKQEQWEQEQVANYQRNRDAYNRAYRACLEGRGYSVQ
jgi:hypothetical protein